MSKQEEAKKSQNYRAKPEWQECRYCLYFRSDKVEMPAAGGGGTYVEEKNLRCFLGGFKVAKLGTCDLFVYKDAEKTKKEARK